jgi:hypothetical protein
MPANEMSGGIIFRGPCVIKRWKCRAFVSSQLPTSSLSVVQDIVGMPEIQPEVAGLRRTLASGWPRRGIASGRGGAFLRAIRPSVPHPSLYVGPCTRKQMLDFASPLLHTLL